METRTLYSTYYKHWADEMAISASGTLGGRASVNECFDSLLK